MKLNATYSKIVQDRVPGETNDCAIVSIVAATGKSYAEVHAHFKELGRKHRGSAFLPQIKEALYRCGYEMIAVDRNVTSRTPKRIGLELTKGTFLVGTAGHIFCLKDGEVCDWTDGRSHRITEVYLVAPINSTHTLNPSTRQPCLEQYKQPIEKKFQGSVIAYIHQQCELAFEFISPAYYQWKQVRAQLTERLVREGVNRNTASIQIGKWQKEKFPNV